MDATTPVDTFEDCPRCERRTATKFFRAVGKKRLCVLCAKRTEEEAVAFREHMEDQRIHGIRAQLRRYLWSVFLRMLFGRSYRL